MYPLLRLISWNLTTQCLVVSGCCSVSDAVDEASPAVFCAHYNIAALTSLPGRFKLQFLVPLEVIRFL